MKNVYITRTVFPDYLSDLRHYEVIEEVLAKPGAFSTKRLAIKNAKLQCEEERVQNYLSEQLEIVQDQDEHDNEQVILRYSCSPKEIVMLVHIQCVKICTS